jgi:hypothetical protein
MSASSSEPDIMVESGFEDQNAAARAAEEKVEAAAAADAIVAAAAVDEATAANGAAALAPLLAMAASVGTTVKPTVPRLNVKTDGSSNHATWSRLVTLAARSSLLTNGLVAGGRLSQTKLAQLLGIILGSVDDDVLAMATADSDVPPEDMHPHVLMGMIKTYATGNVAARQQQVFQQRRALHINTMTGGLPELVSKHIHIHQQMLAADVPHTTSAGCVQAVIMSLAHAPDYNAVYQTL